MKACKLADVYDNLTDMEKLPAERRPHSLERTKFYLDGISAASSPKLKRPLELTRQLWRERSVNK